ncbi:MAG: response regulator [Moorea sp. SIO3I7]|nr:response regulator [Moorena sp. SIO4A1]NEN99227.1 response regulator [Moorena sp. SIO3I7]NEO63191.1 response regulator [Moorena sp. SIO4G2]NEQ63781.1 response regulator [Moorena sp. SIO4A1]
MYSKFPEILLIEDDPGDIELTRKALNKAKLGINLHVVMDGTQALAYLYREGEYADSQQPDLILLDLNLPGMNGQEILQHIKGDDNLKQIPVVMLTTSDAQEDIVKSYDLGANCYLKKPISLKEFDNIIEALENFWFSVVKLPPPETS